MITLLVILFKQPLLMLFGASEVTFPYANTYMTIYAAGSIFAILSMGMNTFIICQGYSKIAMMSDVNKRQILSCSDFLLHINN